MYNIYESMCVYIYIDYKGTCTLRALRTGRETDVGAESSWLPGGPGVKGLLVRQPNPQRLQYPFIKE